MSTLNSPPVEVSELAPSEGGPPALTTGGPSSRECPSCGRRLPLSSFYRSRADPKTVRASCIECTLARSARWRAKNREAHLARRRNAFAKDPRVRRATLESAKRYSAKNRGKIAARMSAWSAKNSARLRKARRLYYRKNRARVIARSKQWRESNRDKRRAQHQREYKNNKLKSHLYSRLNRGLGAVAAIKSGSSMVLFGATIPEIREWLEQKFRRGMSWNNYGRGKEHWSVDHVVPCNAFDLARPDHQRVCFNYRNLRPLWDLHNIAKHKRLPSARQVPEWVAEQCAKLGIKCHT